MKTVEPTERHYGAELTAGSLKAPESRIIADLLLRRATSDESQETLYTNNALQARNKETTRRLARLIRQRLELMDTELWRLVCDGSKTVATHACLAAAIKHSALLGDFLDLVVREQYRLFASKLPLTLWEEYLNDCRGRDALMPLWNDSTRRRLRSSVYQTLAQAGFLDSTRTLRLQPVHIASEVLGYLRDHREEYVLRCIQVSP